MPPINCPQSTDLMFTAISAWAAAIALILNLWQSYCSNTQERATLVAECLKEFADDPDIQSIFYEIEYDKFIYGKDFHGSDQERKVDKLLRHFANLALSWESGLLSIKDIRPVQYYILRVMKNCEILKYMNFLEGWLKKAGVGHQHPYIVLVKLSNKLSK